MLFIAAGFQMWHSPSAIASKSYELGLAADWLLENGPAENGMVEGDEEDHPPVPSPELCDLLIGRLVSEITVTSSIIVEQVGVSQSPSSVGTVVQARLPQSIRSARIDIPAESLSAARTASRPTARGP